MNEKAEDLAVGRWPDILTARGMDPSFFSGRNGPCPFCDGKDRYRWVQKKYGGVWVCSGCTNNKYASGFSMLMQHMGYSSFREAADDVREFFGTNKHIQPLTREQWRAQNDEMTPEKVARNRSRMLRFWDEARDVAQGDPVYCYMQKRVPGMDFIPSDIRYHPALEYWLPPPPGQERPQLLGKFPAMLALARDVNGEVVQLHKTYLTVDGGKADVPLVKKTDLGVGVNSFAVRMMEPIGDRLGVCEGLETGWAAAMMNKIPVWPCLNGHALSEFVLPDELRGQIKKLVIFADSDELKTRGRPMDGVVKKFRPGSEYAAKLADSARRQGLRTLIIRPAKVGFDIADHWNSELATA